MAECCTELRVQIVILHKQKWSQWGIATYFNVSKTGVQKTIKRFENTEKYRSKRID